MLLLGARNVLLETVFGAVRSCLKCCFLGVSWYDYGARMYDPALGRFHTIDPLAEKMKSWSPYTYCFDNPIGYFDPDGREGIKYTDENGQKTVESNVVVLLEQKKAIPEGASDKKIEKIGKQNARIENRNTARMEDVETRLNDTYNGSDGNGKANSSGETVKFKFNMIGVETENTDGGTTQQIREIATEHSLETSEKNVVGGDVRALAAVVTTRSSGGSQGLSNGIFVTESVGAPASTLSHEVGHTLKLRDNYPRSTGGLMDYPAGGLIRSEVDEIWNKAYAK